MIEVVCPSCQRLTNAKAEHIGRRARCKCGHVFVIEERAAQAEVVETLSPAPRAPSPIVLRPDPPPEKKSLFGKLKEAAEKSTAQVFNTADVSESESPSEEKSFFGKLRDAAARSSVRAAAARKCSDCGAKMTMAEIAAKMGKCCRCAAIGIGLVGPDAGQWVFSQKPSYCGGLPDFPGQARKAGFAVVCENYLCFFDNQVRWRAPYERILKADLDFFQPSGVRAVLAGPQAMMLQRVRNNVAVTHFAEDGTEYIVKLQVHGAVFDTRRGSESDGIAQSYPQLQEQIRPSGAGAERWGRSYRPTRKAGRAAQKGHSDRRGVPSEEG